MNALDKKFLRIASASRWQLLRIAMDGSSVADRMIARLCLKMGLALDRPAVDEGKWITVNGTHVKVGEGGEVKAGPAKLKKALMEENGGSASQPAAKPRSNYSTLKGKTKKQADEMSKAISSGKATLREKGMQAHMPNTKEYREHAGRSAINGYQQSMFTDGYKQYVPGIQQALKDKNAVFTRLQDGSISARIDFGIDLGTAFERNGDTKGHPVHAVDVRFSKSESDWHFFPCDLEDD